MTNLGTYTITVTKLGHSWHSKNHPINDYCSMTPTRITESLLPEFTRLGTTSWEAAKVTLWTHIWRGGDLQRICHDRKIIELPLSEMART